MSDTPAARASNLPTLVGAFGVVAVCLALVRTAAEQVTDPDVFWHVLLGQALARSWDFGPTDPLSTFTQGYTYHQWLPELGYGFAEAWGGMPIVAWLAHLLRVGLVLAVYAACRRGADALPSALLTATVILGAAGSLSPRPQVVGLILLAITAALWNASVLDGRPRWVLVPLSWVWACSHGTWVLGVAVGTVVLVGSALDGRMDRRSLRLVWLLASCTAAALVTPVGPRLLRSIIDVAEVRSLISEWQPAGINDPALAVTVGMFLLVVLFRGRNADLRWSTTLLAVFALVLALSSSRSIGPAAVVLAPIAAQRLGLALPHRLSGDRLEWRVIGVAVVAALVLAFPVAGSSPTRLPHLPKGLSPALSSLPPGTRVVNTDTIGGWLLWAHPQLQPLWDTRAEAYGRDYLIRMVSLQSAQPGWESILDSIHPGAVLIGERSALAGALVAQKGWTVAGRDAGYALLLPPAP